MAVLYLVIDLSPEHPRMLGYTTDGTNTQMNSTKGDASLVFYVFCSYLLHFETCLQNESSHILFSSCKKPFNTVAYQKNYTNSLT